MFKKEPKSVMSERPGDAITVPPKTFVCRSSRRGERPIGEYPLSRSIIFAGLFEHSLKHAISQ